MLQHRPYGSAKLSHAKSRQRPTAHRFDVRVRDTVEPGLDTGRAKAGETRGLSADNLIGGSP